jgi:hypothetical protein
MQSKTKSESELLLPRNLSHSEMNKSLLSEIARKRDSRIISAESDLDEIVKISFICVCHGNIISSFRDIESEQSKTLGAPILDSFGVPIPSRLWDPIPSHGKYAKISISTETSYDIPFQTVDVEYKIDDEPVLEFNYQSIDTSHLNVSLTTSGTCAGAVTYRSKNPVRVKQKFVNDIMEEIDETCPTNNFFSELGVFGDTFSTTHKNYKLQQRELKKIEQTRRKDAARRIQRLYKKTRKLLFPLKLFDSEIDHLKKSIKSNLNGKTRLMKYEKERVTTMLNKKYSTCSEDVYTTDLKTTECDAHKLIMIVTRNTGRECKSQKYTLLSTLTDVRKTLGDLNKDFPPSIGELYSKMLSIIQPKSGLTTSRLSLLDILGLGKSIIEEINGTEATRTVPINIYDTSCNSFNSLPSNYAIMKSKLNNGVSMNERELSIIRIIDDFLRAKDIAFGKVKKLKLKKRR